MKMLELGSLPTFDDLEKAVQSFKEKGLPAGPGQVSALEFEVISDFALQNKLLSSGKPKEEFVEDYYLELAKRHILKNFSKEVGQNAQ